MGDSDTPPACFLNIALQRNVLRAAATSPFFSEVGLRDK
jgi:hypothetical protein